MWYWICRGHGDTDGVFRTKFACKSRISAQIALIKERLFGEPISLDPNNEDKLFIMKRKEHPDRDRKQHQCPECGNLMSDKELDSTWDWAGPHCDNCGCTGMEMFSAVNGPVVSGRQGWTDPRDKELNEK